MLALDGEAWGEALAAFGRGLSGVKGILVVSAHWENRGSFRLYSAERPGVMHDFGGFPPELYTLDYPAPGSPELAQRAAELLAGAGLEAELDPARPLDHGAWVPLRHLAPDASIPVVQLSLPRPRDPQLLLRAGRALAPLREESILILGSGGLVHNLGRLDWAGESEPQPWAAAFQAWADGRLQAGDAEGLGDWASAPGARESVPTSEHYDPILVAAGASGSVPSDLFRGGQLGSLSLTSYVFP